MNAVLEDLRDLRTSVAFPVSTIDIRKAIAQARELLMPKRGEGPAYPTAALGPLAEVCASIAGHGQLREAMAGQSLLGAASLLTQGLFNVETLGGHKPLSLYLLTLGESGDGKTTAEQAALHPIWDWQREANAQYQHALAEQEATKAKRKNGKAPPEPPRAPHRLCIDATVEGLRRELSGGPIAQGVFTSEAAGMLAGYGMSAEQRTKTAAVFCGLWDRGLLSVSRATGGRTERHGCRLAMHWLVQPMVAAESIGDAALTAQGLWPRFLLAWPEPSAPRVARRVQWDMQPAIGRYWRRCTELLAQPLPDDANEAVLLPIDPAAERIVSDAFERFEQHAKLQGGELREVKPFALRAAEQLCRTAGVLTAFAGRASVGADEASGALALTLHSLDCWRLAIEQGAADPGGSNALKLYEWLIGLPGHCATTRDISRNAPRPLREGRDTRDAALDRLQACELIDREGSRVFALPGEA